MLKHPDSIAWDRWEETDPASFEGTPSGQYLRNRLHRAFMAGRATLRAEVEIAMNTVRAAHSTEDER